MLYCHHVGAVADALVDEKEKQEMKIVVHGKPSQGGDGRYGGCLSGDGCGTEVVRSCREDGRQWSSMMSV